MSSESTATEPFTADGFKELGELVVAAWEAGLDRDWLVPAGTLEWSCLHTADHTVDCVFSYALFLASGRQDMYPPFGELHAHDVCSGLGVSFEPPTEIVRRLRDAVRTWPIGPDGSPPPPPSDDPWSDLLVASGRSPRPQTR